MRWPTDGDCRGGVKYAFLGMDGLWEDTGAEVWEKEVNSDR